MDAREIIARRVALEFKDGDVVNLGVGIPTLVPAYVPKGIKIWLHSENGIVGVGPKATCENLDKYLLDAGKKYCTIVQGGAITDSATSFGMIRGGHLAATVLGALQVDEKGNLANWIVPGGKLTGMGGAMDLVAGAKRVIIATEHTSKDGTPKIKRQCTFPLTGKNVVDLIVTELAVIKVTSDGLLLQELAPGITVEEVKAKTEPQLKIPAKVPQMPI
jgi:acetate CoA/acetoacetate CoA-transferase beta subunit